MSEEWDSLVAFLSFQRREGPLDQRSIFEGMRRSVRMFVPGGTYHEAAALLTGYFLDKPEQRISFQAWIVSRFGGERNVAWWVHVLRVALADVKWDATLTPAEDAIAIDKLCELLIAWDDDLRRRASEPTGRSSPSAS